jgi:hypothetical protein
MGPREPVPLSESGGAPDHAARAIEFAKRHPGVSIYVTPYGWEASWIELPTGAAYGEAKRVYREILGHLIDELEGKFDG